MAIDLDKLRRVLETTIVPTDVSKAMLEVFSLLDEANQAMVTEINVDAVPAFRQGKPTHELEKLVTVERCKWFVDTIKNQERIIYLAKVQISDLRAALKFANLEHPTLLNKEVLRATGEEFLK